LPVKWPVISPRLRFYKLLMIKEKITNKIWMLLVLSSFLLAQDSLNNSSNIVEKNVPAVKNGSGFVETTNRLPQLLKDVKIFDVYQGDNIISGKKSIAFNVTLEPKDKTLSEKDIDQVSKKIISIVQKTTGATLRS